MDVVSAITQDALIAIDVTNLGFAGDNAFESCARCGCGGAHSAFPNVPISSKMVFEVYQQYDESCSTGVIYLDTSRTESKPSRRLLFPPRFFPVWPL